jgi:hypothetical protein
MISYSTLMGDLYSMKRAIEHLSDTAAKLPRDTYATNLQNNLEVIENFINTSIQETRQRAALQGE